MAERRVGLHSAALAGAVVEADASSFLATLRRLVAAARDDHSNVYHAALAKERLTPH